ncbi:hypothetical protein AB0E01_22770 [Nocardia vinacea]|uniref:hypothetical protein n=1 Tax=Nocardia vinacea TaxID=96468 RepID=UPI0033E8FC86
MSNTPDLLTGVEQFMTAVKQAIATTPHLPHYKTRCLRMNLLEEEVAEYFDADESDDLEKAVDGLLDIIVVAYGTLLSYVGPEVAQECADEVTRANLAKIRPDGTFFKRADGKVEKPEGWQPPDIAGVLARHGYKAAAGVRA